MKNNENVVTETVTVRAFNASPEFVKNSEGNLVPAYATDDPFTKDFADLMFVWYTSDEDNDEIFKRDLKVFNEFWNLDLVPPDDVHTFLDTLGLQEGLSGEVEDFVRPEILKQQWDKTIELLKI